MLRYTRGGYYLVSAIAAVVTLPAIVVAVSVREQGCIRRFSWPSFFC